MTCASCRGTKIYRRPKPDNTINPRYPPEYDEITCPDCAPKPFARVVSGSLYIGRHERPIDQSGYSLGTVVQLINEEAEAREAKLAGVIDRLRNAIDAYDFSMGLMGWQGMLKSIVDAAMVDEYAPGDVACGLAFDLGAAQSKTEGVWGVLIDALLKVVEEGGGGKALELAMAIADRLGAKLPPSLHWIGPRGEALPIADIIATYAGGGPQAFREMLSDTELAQECVRRGWSFETPPVPVEMGLQPRFVARITGVDPAQPGGDQTVLMASTPRGETAFDRIIDDYAEMLGAPPQLLRRAPLNPRYSVLRACMRAGLDYTQERHDYAMAFLCSRTTTDPATVQEIANELLSIEGLPPRD